MRVYTKGGDKGTTSLISGERVKKYDIRVEAYGTVDELSAYIALLSDKMRSYDSLTSYCDELQGVIRMLMNIEAHFAAGERSSYPLPPIPDESIEQLEGSIDTMQSELPTINRFTIPGGCELNSLCHLCRTVCRRAERRAVELADSHEVEPNALIYINRLSDYLYLMGRYTSMQLGYQEEIY